MALDCEPPRLSAALAAEDGADGRFGSLGAYDIALAMQNRRARVEQSARASGAGGAGGVGPSAPGRAPPLLARLGAAGAYVAERRVRDAYAHLAAALAAAADDGEGLLGERLAAVVDVCYEALLALRPATTAAARAAPLPEILGDALGAGISRERIEAAAKAANKLKAWVMNAAKKAKAAPSGGATAAAAPPMAQAVEFGQDSGILAPRAAPLGGDGGGAWWFSGLVEGGAGGTQGASASAASLSAALAAVAGEQAVEAVRQGETTASSANNSGSGRMSDKAAPVTYGLRWLVQVCAAARELGGSDSFRTDEESAAALCGALLSAPSDDAAGAMIFDILGEGAFEAIAELVAHRGDVAKAAAAAAATVTGAGGGAAGAQGDSSRRFGTHGTGVSVQTARAKAAAKARRKEAKRAARSGMAVSGAEVEVLLAEPGGFEAMLASEAGTAEERAATAQVTGAGSAIKDDLLAIGAGDGADWMKSSLPKGTMRVVNTKEGYEEVRVPAAATASSLPDEEMVPITALPRWAQLPFKGYKSFNRIQSRIFPTGFYSNENVLVCAPTGAGKTNIAMISVLREIGQHVVEADDGSGATVELDDFKIVYVAPMKALAAEMASAFQRRLEPLGLQVRELTGDMSLTKRELEDTQMIVTTPEKWDVITRKPTDQALAGLVRLLIIDEVHLLADGRGAVIEALVSRTLRQVEVSQSMIRIVGLSATLPNYKDVATFLGVNHQTGLFHFGPGFRPIPLEQQYIGVMEKNIHRQKERMNHITYAKVVDALRNGKQAMVFVHSRKETAKTARALLDLAKVKGDIDLFDPSAQEQPHPQLAFFKKDVGKSRNSEMAELALQGFGVHHAGMLRPDRTLSERLFAAGITRVLCCTATLAWGVNLPAHTVVIKGTSIYAPDKGAFIDLGMLDVAQIFGRAGRPQFDTSGEGILITTHDKLPHYLSLMCHASPIESAFVAGMVDNLNAEVVLGTVTNVNEAVRWLGYSYLHVRMQSNPLHYGMRWEDAMDDPGLMRRRREIVGDAARALDRARMVRYDERSGNLYQTEQGRVASHYYIKAVTIERFNERLKPLMSEGEVLDMVAHASEFDQVAVREEEMPELERLAAGSLVPHAVRSGGVATREGKVNVLIQAYISKARLTSFSLTSDGNYVASNLARILRALFELALRRGAPGLAHTLLQLAIAAQRQVWPHQQPLRQMASLLKDETLYKLEQHTRSIDRLWECDEGELGEIVRHPGQGHHVRSVLDSFPGLALELSASPITRSVLQVRLSVWPEFRWHDRAHGGSMRWHVWVEDANNEHIYHSEIFSLTKKTMGQAPHVLAFTIPIFEPLPPQYFVRAISDEWLGAEAVAELSFKGMVLPNAVPAHTELLPLRPLRRAALEWPAAEALYERKFTHFNAVQTQAFHTLYHTDNNVLMGAPTGSGKTVIAELAILRAFREHPGRSVVYVAPLKSLVRERVDDWGKNFCPALGKSLVELTGDHSPDLRALLKADIIVTTPEKWDGVSRAWANRAYVRRASLVVIDEIHLLGADRGPVLEAIVSRMRHVAGRAGCHIRVVGLSTALANAHDLGAWLGVEPVRKGSMASSGLFNFRPSVRPIPMEVHIQGYPGRFYCPRMATMNKPCYSAIRQHSPLKPTLIFVASRRQTRLTALDIIAHAASDEAPRQFLRMPLEELEPMLERVSDASLRHTLQFGIGLHHAGLKEADRKLVERLFLECKVQVLVSTSTLAWGVNLPAHLVIVKGTEFYDGARRQYVDFPITDVLQMMGRAGRPQFDTRGVAVIMVHEPKKSYYKRFLYEPFPVESSLHEQLTDHLNAEVVAGTVRSPQDAIDYLTWTYLFRRLAKNPTYYGLDGTTSSDVNDYLSSLVEDSLTALEASGCVSIDDHGGSGPYALLPTPLGKVASLCYLRHETAGIFALKMREGMGTEELLECLCAAAEFDELPVRHNEDALNLELADEVPVRVDLNTVDDPHTKAHLLLQAHLSRLVLPVSDYITDTKTVLDSTLRLAAAMVDISAQAGWLDTTLALLALQRALRQARWPEDPPLSVLPGVSLQAAKQLARGKGLGGAGGLAALASKSRGEALRAMGHALGSGNGVESGGTSRAMAMLEALPLLSASASLDRASREVIVKLRRKGGRHPNDSGKTKGGGGPKGKRRRQALGRAIAPLWPRPVEEGWHAVLCGGDAGSNELLAIRRVNPVIGAAAATVRLAVPNSGGASLGGLRVHIVSSAYPGLDVEAAVDIATSPVSPSNANASASPSTSVAASNATSAMGLSGDGDAGGVTYQMIAPPPGMAFFAPADCGDGGKDEDGDTFVDCQP